MLPLIILKQFKSCSNLKLSVVIYIDCISRSPLAPSDLQNQDTPEVARWNVRLVPHQMIKQMGTRLAKISRKVPCMLAQTPLETRRLHFGFSASSQLPEQMADLKISPRRDERGRSEKRHGENDHKVKQ